MRKYGLLFLILPVMFGCAQYDTGANPENTLGRVEQESVIGGIEPSNAAPILTICWANASSSNATARNVVRNTLISEFHSRTRIRFAGFHPCPVGGTEPDSESRTVAMWFYPNGDSHLYEGTRSFSSGKMGGKIVFNQDTNLGPVAIHEMGHQVGLYHEQDRADSPCRLESGVYSNEDDWSTYGPYDAQSIMNYCGGIGYGHLSQGDILALQKLHGASGNFIQEGNRIYRYHRGHKCHVVSPEQLNAFGGSKLVAQGIIEPENMGRVVYDGPCRWPDGFYKPADTNRVLYAIGGSEILPLGGTHISSNTDAKVCWIENPSQLAVYSGSGDVQYVSTSTSEMKRSRVGSEYTRCPWPVGFYSFSDSPKVYRVSKDSYCWVYTAEELAFLGGAQMVRHVVAGSTVFTGRTYKGTCDLTNFWVTNKPIQHFATWAAAPGVKAVSGDFNGDGRTDMALMGVSGWQTIPVAFSNGNGTFNVTNYFNATWANIADDPGVKAVAGDFNGDGKDDLALTGVLGWQTIPVAFSNGNGTFTVTNYYNTTFAYAADDPGAMVLAGDFNGDGKDDLALTGVAGWTSIPVAFSQGNGTFGVTNYHNYGFAYAADDPGAMALAGDFDGDGKDDLALTGVAGWNTLPVAFSNGNGTFDVTNKRISGIHNWSTLPGVQAVAGDFNGDGKDDIALTGAHGWMTIPVALSRGNGSFRIENKFVSQFPAWAHTPGVIALCGDYNGDGKADIALTGPNGWNTLPIAFRELTLIKFPRIPVIIKK